MVRRKKNSFHFGVGCGGVNGWIFIILIIQYFLKIKENEMMREGGERVGAEEVFTFNIFLIL